MNSQAGAKNIVSSKATNVLVLGDGNWNTARNSIRGLPKDWKQMPADLWFWRHMGGANYAFADGHVKWLKPENIVAGAATFTP